MNADEQRLHANCAARVRAIQRFHMDEMGWLDIAYNHVFCRHGYVFVGRGFGARSASRNARGTPASPRSHQAEAANGISALVQSMVATSERVRGPGETRA
jgi:hypothetical protein